MQSLHKIKKAYTKLTKVKQLAVGISGLVTAGAFGLGTALHCSVLAGEFDVLHPPSYSWPQSGMFSSHDHGSVRRGYFVYKNVCAACHSMKYMRYYHMVDVCFTEAEAKAEAASMEVLDPEPDDDGKPLLRPGKISDYFPKPYANDKAAMAANNGALPPDLNLIVKAREGNEDYIFSLLTGYCEAPPGVKVEDPQYYNPYFKGGAIGMTPPLYNETYEYEDGTKPSQSQLAKDVTCFLSWASEFCHDDRKRTGFKVLPVVGIMALVMWYIKRSKWSVMKTRKYAFIKKSL